MNFGVSQSMKEPEGIMGEGSTKIFIEQIFLCASTSRLNILTKLN